jgi:hypothetical protein
MFLAGSQLRDGQAMALARNPRMERSSLTRALRMMKAGFYFQKTRKLTYRENTNIHKDFAADLL